MEKNDIEFNMREIFFKFLILNSKIIINYLSKKIKGKIH